MTRVVNDYSVHDTGSTRSESRRRQTVSVDEYSLSNRDVHEAHVFISNYLETARQSLS